MFRQRPACLTEWKLAPTFAGVAVAGNADGGHQAELTSTRGWVWIEPRAPMNERAHMQAVVCGPWHSGAMILAEIAVKHAALEAW